MKLFQTSGPSPRTACEVRRRIGPGVAGVVDQDADRAELGLGLGDHGLDVAWSETSACSGNSLAAGGADLLRHGLGALQHIVVDDHAAAALCGRQMQGDLPPDALAGAGDQGDAPAQIEDVRHTFLSRPFQ